MLNSFFSRKKTDSHSSLEVEALESRMMLSTVSIFAAGQTGQENVDLFIDDQYVTTFNNVGGDVGSRDFVELTFQTDEVLTPGRIGVAFGNDAFDPNTGEDRNLLVDKIVVDGVSVETEDPSTRSTGIYRNGLTGPGNFETELFNINAIFTYADPDGQADRVEFVAAGTTGDEIVEVFIGGQVVRTFNFRAADTAEVFSFSASEDVSLEDVEIRFVNDLFDPANGIDRNVQVFEFSVIDGQAGAVSTANTNDANVLSSGIFVAGQGITIGFGAGGFLASNGSVQLVTSGTTLTATLDSGFQNDSVLSNKEGAVGRNNQVASVSILNALTVVDDAGIPVSTFGDNGTVNLRDLLLGLGAINVNSPISYTDLEFFDDGSILVSGAVADVASFSNQNVDPFIFKLNPDGSIDQSFSQQGIVQGTFLQFFGIQNNNELKSAIDNDGRVLLFGPNTTGLTDADYTIARLNSDGSLDTTFGNGGNVFISGSQAGFGEFSNTNDVRVTADNRLVFAVENEVSLVLGRLNENGSLDSSFGDGGFTTVSTPQSSEAFALDSQERIVILSDPDFSALTRLTPDGQVDSSFGDNGFVLLEPDNSTFSQGVGDTTNFFGGFAIDSQDNVLVGGSVEGNDGSRPLLLQRVFADGQVDEGFGIAGSSVLPTSEGSGGIQRGVNQLFFDSEDRLIVGSSVGGISRVVFV